MLGIKKKVIAKSQTPNSEGIQITIVYIRIKSKASQTRELEREALFWYKK